MPNNLTDTEENRLLDLSLVDGDLLALVSALGTDSAAGTEVVGGSYARQMIDWAAAAGGAKTTAAAITYTSMPAVKVLGWEIYNSTGTTRRWYGVFYSVTASAQTAGDTITAPAHGLGNDTQIVFQSGFAPAGLSAGTIYFVRNATTNNFQLSTTLGGAVADVTADTSTVVFGKVLEVVDSANVNLAPGAVTCSLS